MQDMTSIEIIVFAFYGLQLLLYLNIILRLLAHNTFLRFKKYNKAIVIWVLSIALALYLLHLPALLHYHLGHQH